MEYLDKAIEALTQLRIQFVKEKRNDLEQKLYEVEQLLFKAYDNSGKPFVMPSLFAFKERRTKSKLTLREVETATGISNAYLSQLENGKIKRPSFEVVEKLHILYANNGA